ncbi:hypothetical protein [Mycoplasmopsis cynos]|uniref:Uncharacterized protein n=1 Tax=Mycoplasmopsis cynos TaxID=171284 RepID=A0A449AIK5_9BACT|nr:hypothetical protein [Mycoplasmopsis cynos]MCU9933244.1 hypothetical protein [Mycoplasmopsis cynos]MCU9935515.1 hypothetical protein [Mycoplasmopsis cynos]TQC55086.1 hypothetical protein E1I74_00075 [Mycoplasmopsis cynos]UWV92242.1 hypothetical protein NWE57_05085 [Mycoplasmopsis cynos]WAM05759.1 hypothetical protein OM999_00530 [Mycoplasmopsis cynos]
MKKKEFEIDFVKFRKQEIEYAIQKAKLEEQLKEKSNSQKEIPFYKRELFFNITTSIFVFIIIIALLIGAWFIGTTS